MNLVNILGFFILIAVYSLAAKGMYKMGFDAGYDASTADRYVAEEVEDELKKEDKS